MQKKLTITVHEEVYAGLYKTIGTRKISKFVEELVRLHVVRPRLEAAYSQMAKDKKREKKALEWAEATFSSGLNPQGSRISCYTGTFVTTNKNRPRSSPVKTVSTAI